RELESGCHANPNRGPTLPFGDPFMTEVSLLLRTTPLGGVPGKFPAATNPEKVPPPVKSLLAIWGQKFTRYPCVSTACPNTSQRTPRFSVSLLLTLKSSEKYAA